MSRFYKFTEREAVNVLKQHPEGMTLSRLGKALHLSILTVREMMPKIPGAYIKEWTPIHPDDPYLTVHHTVRYEGRATILEYEPVWAFATDCPLPEGSMLPEHLYDNHFTPGMRIHPRHDRHRPEDKRTRKEVVPQPIKVDASRRSVFPPSRVSDSDTD